MNTVSKVAGRYKIQAFVPGRPPRVLADWFPNLITDYGMDLMSGAVSGYTEMWNYCSVGTGNAPPAFGNTNLVNRKASTNSTASSLIGNEENYIWRRITYQFPQGAATGNLAEVGIGVSSTGDRLFSRALIKDASGNPTTITVLPDEVLQVVWEIRHYFPQPTTSTVMIAGSGEHECSVAVLNKSSTVNVFFNCISNNFYPYSRIYSGVTGLAPETASSLTYSKTESLTDSTPATYTNGTFKTQKPLHCRLISLIFRQALADLKYRAHGTITCATGDRASRTAKHGATSTRRR